VRACGEAWCERKLGSQHRKMEPASPVGMPLSAAHPVKIQSSQAHRPDAFRGDERWSVKRGIRGPAFLSGNPASRQRARRIFTAATSPGSFASRYSSQFPETRVSGTIPVSSHIPAGRPDGS